jgi:hypothetical protein
MNYGRCMIVFGHDAFTDTITDAVLPAKGGP